MLGKTESQKEKGMAEVEMSRQRHWLNGHGFEQIPETGGTWESGVLQSTQSLIVRVNQ